MTVLLSGRYLGDTVSVTVLLSERHPGGLGLGSLSPSSKSTTAGLSSACSILLQPPLPTSATFKDLETHDGESPIIPQGSSRTDTLW